MGTTSDNSVYGIFALIIVGLITNIVLLYTYFST